MVNSETSKVIVVRGYLPLSIIPSFNTNLIHLDSSRQLEFIAASQPRAVLWSKLAERTGIILTEPDLTANLSGTWEAPRGKIELQARQIQLRKAFPTMPALDDLHIAVQLDRDRASLKEGHLLVQGQSVGLMGELPLGESFWAGLKGRKFPIGNPQVPDCE